MIRKMLAMVAAMLVLATVVLAEPGNPMPLLDGGELTGVTYSCSGDEVGNIYRASISYSEEGTLVLTVEEAEYWGDPVVVRRYRAAEDTLRRIVALAEANGMARWHGREDKLFVCDAPQPWLTLYILDADGETRRVEIDGYILFSDEELEAYRAVLDIVLESAQDDRLIETYTYEQN